MSPVDSYGPYVWLVIVTRYSEHNTITEVDSVWTHNFLAQRRMLEIRTIERDNVLAHCAKHIISGGTKAVQDYARTALRRAQ